MEKYFLFKIFTPEGQFYSSECDGVTFNICDDKNGKSGGSYGVKKGHTNAVFVLSGGVLTAKREGVVILSVNTTEGFAKMEDGVLTVVTDKIKNTD